MNSTDGAPAAHSFLNTSLYYGACDGSRPAGRVALRELVLARCHCTHAPQPPSPRAHISQAVGWWVAWACDPTRRPPGAAAPILRLPRARPLTERPSSFSRCSFLPPIDRAQVPPGSPFTSRSWQLPPGTSAGPVRPQMHRPLYAGVQVRLDTSTRRHLRPVLDRGRLL